MTEEQAHDGPPRVATWRRRSVIAGLAGTGLAATTFGTARWLQGAGDGAVPATARRAAASPADAGGFANRDESYASAGGRAPARTSATVAEPTTLFPTAAEAAAAATVAAPTILDPSDPVVHLLRRTTFGPTPELVAEVRAVGIDAWIAAQLDPASIPDPASEMAWATFPLATADPATIRASIERTTWDAMMAYGKATVACQAWSNRQLFEVMVDFWANHLNVPTPGPGGWDVACSYQHDVIRTHALGSFTDMLLAAGRHPAMLRYLTAEQSTKDSVNENYGRELLELHTVGVASGYTEADVRHSAYILTGRSVVGRDEPDEGSFVYEPDKHWVGAVTVLDFHHDNGTAEGGMEVGDAYLRHLAAHPATAQTIARKLAVRFVSDVPPPALVDRLAQAYLDGGTAIRPVLDVMFRSAEFWSAVGQKTRRPLENIAASVRILGVAPGGDVAYSTEALYRNASRLGQRPVSWPAPNGYPDVQAAWRSVGSIIETWNLHRMLAGGWDDGLTQPDPLGLVSGLPAGTVGEYVDSLCRRLCFQTFQAPHRDALVGFLGGDPVAPIGDVQQNRLEAVVALVLDSPYFSLR